jgi:hypothetical protein
MKPRLASTEDVVRVHHPKHLERLGKAVDFDSDTPYYPEIETHARRAAGAAIGSVDLALSGRKGFCSDASARSSCDSNPGDGILLSELDCDRRLLRSGMGCDRVAIWDFDAHHGTALKRSTRVTIGSGSLRFTNIPVTRATGQYRAGMFSIGPSQREPMRESTPRLLTGRWTVYWNSIRISCWFQPALTLLNKTRSQR